MFHLYKTVENIYGYSTKSWVAIVIWRPTAPGLLIPSMILQSNAQSITQFGYPSVSEYTLFGPDPEEKVNRFEGAVPAKEIKASNKQWRSMKRLHASDALMSKLACTLLSNMVPWDVKAMTPRHHERNKSINALIDMLNDDAGFKAIFNRIKLSLSESKRFLLLFFSIEV